MPSNNLLMLCTLFFSLLKLFIFTEVFSYSDSLNVKSNKDEKLYLSSKDHIPYCHHTILPVFNSTELYNQCRVGSNNMCYTTPGIDRYTGNPPGCHAGIFMDTGFRPFGGYNNAYCNKYYRYWFYAGQLRIPVFQ